MVRRPDNWWVPNRAFSVPQRSLRSAASTPTSVESISADWTWLLGLSILGEFVRVPHVFCDKYYMAGSVSKRWPHDASQLQALRRAGIAEIKRSSLSPARKRVLARYLWRRVVGRRLPFRVKGVFRRLGL